MSGEDKTEAATPRKRGELRKKGQVARSQDLSSILVFVGAIVCIHALWSSFFGRLGTYMHSTLASVTNEPLSQHTLALEGSKALSVLGATVGPLALTALTLGSLSSMVQSGFLISTEALKPDFTRLNPLAGLKRFVSARGAVETVKNIIRLCVVSYVAWTAIQSSYPLMLQSIRQDLPSFMHIVGNLLYRMALKIAAFLFVLSAADYGFQRYSFEKSIRMTKEEVRQEAKQSDGNPQIKAKIRQRQRQMAKRRMMDDVPTADVIITNPTHFAIALKYNPLENASPRVVAKGADLIAKRIREIAEANNIPLVENPPLARGLFKAVEIGREIPGEFFTAVAEVLAYVYGLRNRRI